MKGNSMRNLVMAAALASLSVGCSYSKDIKEYPEPWQTLDPGKPLEKFPKIEILEQGGGPIIEPGDLVQLQINAIKLSDGSQLEKGNWWIWIGFIPPKETAFFSTEPDVASALLGIHEGTALRFLEGKEARKLVQGVSVTDRSGQFQLHITPFGSHEYYSWRKNSNEFVGFSEPSYFGYSILKIKRVCKGPLQYRTVRLFDDSPVQVCSGLKCYTSDKPSEAWVDEAHLEATCSDGKVAIFQYGPIDSRSGRAGRSPVMGYFDDWLRDAWQRIPLGVQLK